jgi:hypothetical protein
VFVDHFSWLSYVHLQQSTSGEETLQAKRAFEAYANSHGVTIRHYHADNGCFIEPTFQKHCEDNHQTFSYSGVNAHFQNSITEKRIRDLQDSARTMLVHAKHRWPTAINAHLWPYALRMANAIHMNAPMKSGKAPLDLFSKVASTSAPKPVLVSILVPLHCMQEVLLLS